MSASEYRNAGLRAWAGPSSPRGGTSVPGLARDQVPGQRPHHFQPAGLVQPGRLLRQASPSQGEFGRHRPAVPGLVGVPGERLEHLPLGTELVAQCPPIRQILVDPVGHGRGAHDAPPGQGRATARSASTSSLT